MANLTEIGLTSVSSDPGDPSAGESTLWMSDGTGSGSDGDILMKTTKADGTTKTINVTTFAGGSLSSATLKDPIRTGVSSNNWTIGTWQTPANTGPNFVIVRIDIDYSWSGSSSNNFLYRLKAQKSSDSSDLHVVDAVDRGSTTGLAGEITDNWKPTTLVGWIPNGYDWNIVEETAADSVAENAVQEFAFG